MKILVSILNYHQSDLLINLLENLKVQSLKDKLYIYIGDVTAINEEKELLINYIESIKDSIFVYYVELKDNYGYAKGNNQIVKAAMENDYYDHVIICNPDINIENTKLIENLISTMENIKDCAVIAPRVITHEGRQQGPYNKQYPFIYTLKHFFPFIWYPFWKYREYKIKNIKSIVKVWRVIGAFMIINMNDFLEIGMFDENTFLYWEEEILSFKLQKYNKYTYFDCKNDVRHIHGSNGKKQISTYDINSMKYYFKLVGYKQNIIKICEISVNTYNKICEIIGKK